MKRPRPPKDARLLLRSGQRRRLLGFTGLLLVCFGVLAWRLVHLQVRQNDFYTEVARTNLVRLQIHAPRRGDIVDAKGNLLARSLFVKTVCADPTLVGTNQALVARVVAPYLKLDEASLRELLRPRFRTDEKGRQTPVRFVVLKRKVLLEEWEPLAAALQSLPLGVDEASLSRRERRAWQNLRRRLAKSIFAESVDDQLRFYPNGTLAAHVLGFTGFPDPPPTNAWCDTIAGKDGIECLMNAALTGVRGWRQTERDARGRELVAHRGHDVMPRPGLKVVLTLDIGLQSIVESELAEAMARHRPKSISAVAVRPSTGEILALANLPTFNPNAPGQASLDARRNRVIADVHEPGSTFKIVVVSGALNEGAVRLSTVFHCENGQFRYKGTRLRDVHPYGPLSVEDIIMKSSNIGAAKIGILLGEARLDHYVRAFGFGHPTGIRLPGEVGGIVHPTNRWSKIALAWIPMGHEVAVTPIQMVMAMSALANGGRLMRPQLVQRLEDEDGQVVARFTPTVLRQVTTEAAARQMVRALTKAVSNQGTGKRAQLDLYDVAGKTGTAQKIEQGVYSHTKHYASFIGFFPADDPQLCLSVILDEPREGTFGGETAAPTFQRIAQRAASYLGIPPKEPSTPGSPGEKRWTTGRPTSPTLTSARPAWD